MAQRKTYYRTSRAATAYLGLQEVRLMICTFPLMNDAISMTIFAAISMALHRTMMFRGSLFDTWHSVDSGCGIMAVVSSWKSPFELDV